MTRPSDPFVMYSSTYENSRERFRRQHDYIRRFWPRAQLVQQPVGDGLTIDWISGKARKNNDKLLVLTCGEHGAEGIVGAAVLQVFFEASLTMMDADHTGVLQPPHSGQRGGPRDPETRRDCRRARFARVAAFSGRGGNGELGSDR